MIGYRVWAISSTPDGQGPYLLRSPWFNTIWYGREQRASAIPAADNQTGIYSRARQGKSPHAVGALTLVHGAIRLSGVVVEHEDGTLRAEEVEILSLDLTSHRDDYVTIPYASDCAYLAHPWRSLHPQRPVDITRTELLGQLLDHYGVDRLDDWPW